MTDIMFNQIYSAILYLTFIKCKCPHKSSSLYKVQHQYPDCLFCCITLCIFNIEIQVEYLCLFHCRSSISGQTSLRIIESLSGPTPTHLMGIPRSSSIF